MKKKFVTLAGVHTQVFLQENVITIINTNIVSVINNTIKKSCI